MTNARTPVATWLFALAGVAALWPAAPEGRSLLLATMGGLVLAALLERFTAARIPLAVGRAADATAVTAIVVLAVLGGGASRTGVAYVLCAAQLARALRKKDQRDQAVMQGIAAAQLVLAAFLTRDFAYLPVLAAGTLFGILSATAAPAGPGAGEDVRVFLGRPQGRAGVAARVGRFVHPALLLLVTAAIAMALFVVLPRGPGFRKETGGAAAPGPIDFDSGGDPDGPARSGSAGLVVTYTERVVLGQIGEAKQFPREAFTVTVVEDRRPVRIPDADLYFRGTALDVFDGRTWSRDPVANPDRWLTTPGGRGRMGVRPELPLGRPAGRRVEQIYRLRRSSFTALPHLGVVQSVDLGDALPRVRELGHDCYAAPAPHEDGTTVTLESRVTGDPLRPIVAPRLTLAERERLTRLPPGLSRTAEAARAAAGSGDALARIEALSTWLRERCSYTLQFGRVPPENAIEHFLFETRAGHCEYFASALAVMLRAVDVPTRLVTGFRGGLWIAGQESFYVRMSDAHAWVEAYVDGRGWVRVDPTPADSAAVGVPDSRVPGAAGETAEEDWFGERFAHLVSEFGPEDRGAAFEAAKDWAAFLAREGFGAGRESRPWPPPGLVLLGLAVFAFGLHRLVRRKRSTQPATARASAARPAAPPADFYRRTLQLLKADGIDRRASESPRELADRAGAARGERVAALPEITGIFEAVRYGGASPDPASERRAAELVDRLAAGLRPGPAPPPP